MRHVAAARVAQDVESADLSGVAGTPTFFINGQRHYGAYDVPTLTAAIKIARARVAIKTDDPGPLLRRRRAGSESGSESPA
jgi:hypothetical protein